MDSHKVKLLIDKYECTDHRRAIELVDNPIVSKLLDEAIDLKKRNGILQSRLDEIFDCHINDTDPLVITTLLDILCDET